MQDSFHSSQRELHLADAMEWLMRLQAEPENTLLIRQHLDWLAASPEHQSAWEHSCHTWRLLQTLPPMTASPAHQGRRTANSPVAVSDALPVDVQPKSATVIPISRWTKRLRQTAALAVAACLLLVTLPGITLFFQADYSTGVGQTSQITLADGSQLYLGADSAIAEDYSDNERRIRLLKGEAFFDVMPDRSRPFVVDARHLQVTVLGTKFNVVLGKLSESVSVASGKVGVQNRNSANSSSFSRQLLPGEQLTLAHSGQLSLGSLAIEDVGSWRDKRIYVQDAAIADVAATLQRYHTSRILIPDNDLASQRVTGAYDLAAPDQALESLVSPYQGNVHHLSNLLRIVSR